MISKFARHGCRKYALQLLSLLLHCPQGVWLPVWGWVEDRGCASESVVFVNRKMFELRTRLLNLQALWATLRTCGKLPETVRKKVLKWTNIPAFYIIMG